MKLKFGLMYSTVYLVVGIYLIISESQAWKIVLNQILFVSYVLAFNIYQKWMKRKEMKAYAEKLLTNKRKLHLEAKWALNSQYGKDGVKNQPVWKKECVNCEQCHDLWCNFYNAEIVVGRTEYALTCLQYAKRSEEK